MNGAAPLSDDREERLYARLAEYLETHRQNGALDGETVVADDPDVAAGMADYIDAVQTFNRLAAPLRQLATQYQPAPVPSRLGDYELLEEIGRGGTAVVYRARQKGLNRLVAVKMVHGGRSGSLYDVDRMRFEAEAVALLEHPGIVPIHEIGEHEGAAYFSMKLYEGGSLAGRLEEFRDHPRRAAELVASIAEAVHHAHQRGILHRDLKPSNILLDAEGRPHVADFGLAKRIASDQELTRTGELIGTPAYLAPERVPGSPWAGPATTATDVYGLGAILYALLTGRPPFLGESSLSTLLAVGTDETPAPTTLNPNVARDLETICLKCLEKDPGRRYGSALELAEDLRRWLSDEPIAARQTGRVERLRRWCRRHPARATAAIAGSALASFGVVGLIVGYLLINQANDVAERHRVDAVAKAAELNRRLYVSQMALSFQHWERGELADVGALIDQFRDQPDLQGFEWRWLQRQARLRPKELVRFTGHNHIVYGGAFSPDGRTVATCGADATIQLWDSTTGELRHVFETGAGLSALGQKFDEDCVCFSPDGKTLASTCEDGSVRLWTLADGSHRDLLPSPPRETFSVEFSTDGKRLVTASQDGVLRVWDTVKCELSAVLAEYGVPAHWAAFSPASAEVAAIDRSGNVIIWNYETGQVRQRLSAGVETYCLAYSPEGTLLATEGPNATVVIWRAATGERVAGLAAHAKIRSFAFSPDATYLAAGGGDGDVRFWSLADGKLKQHFRVDSEAVWTVRFAPDGTRLLTTGSDRTARIWQYDPSISTNSGTDVTAPLNQIVFAPGGRLLALTTQDGELRIGDAVEHGMWETVPVSVGLNSRPAFAPGGRELACIGTNGEIQRWRCRERRLLPAYDPPSLIPGAPDWKRCWTALAYLDDDRLAALTSNGALLLCESGTWHECRPALPVDGQARLLAPFDGGRRLALSAVDPSQIEFWNIAENRLEETLRCEVHLATGVVSPDGQWLACGQSNGTIEMIDLESTDARKLLFGHRNAVNSLAFSADSHTLASGGSDGTVRLWNVATGMEMFILETRHGVASSVAFSPDGNLLGVAGDPRDDGSTLSIYRADPEP